MQQFTSIGKDMMIADKYFKLYLRDRLLPYGLNAAEGIVLLMMYQKSASFSKDTTDNNESIGNTQDELIREIHYDKGVMTRTMKELEQKGYVVRETNPTDSRSYLFSLTEKGLSFKITMLEILSIWNTNLLDKLSKKDLEIVESALKIMSENAAHFYSEVNTLNNITKGRK